LHSGKDADEIVDFLCGEGESHGDIGLLEGGASLGLQWDADQRARVDLLEEAVDVGHYGFDHAVVEQRQDGFELVCREVSWGVKAVSDAALDAFDGVHAAIVQNVGGFARPGRNGTGTGTNQYCGIALRLEFVFYIEDIAQALSRGSIQGALELDDVEVVSLEIS
jgi:hypothetical protein